MPTAYHMVHYRRFGVSPPVKNSTFESLCRAALDRKDQNGATLWKRAQDRVFTVSDSDSKQIVLNKIADLQGAIFGEMCLVQSSGLQALLRLQASDAQLSNLTVAQIYDLQENTAPSGSQFIRGMLYWLAIGDHIFFVKTQSMSSDNFKDYVDWLLKQTGSSIQSSSQITIQAAFDKSQVAGDIGDIKSLRVSGRAAQPMVVQPAALDGGTRTVSTARRVSDKMVEFAQALPVVRALLGEVRTESLVDSLGPDEYLAVDATVKIRGRRTQESRQRMGALANELADLTEGKVQVEGKDGKVSDDDAILRTRMPFDLAQEGSNFLEFDNVADQLQEVYSRFVRDGKIPAA